MSSIPATTFDTPAHVKKLHKVAFITEPRLSERPERPSSEPPSGIRRLSELVPGRSNLTLLAEGAQNGADLRSLEQLVRNLEPAVRRTCRGVLGGGHADLEDAVQDCLLEVVRALPNYRFQGDFLHYANKISLRVASLTRRRSTERRVRFDTLDAAVSLENEAPQPTSASDELDRARQLRRVLRALPGSQAEALSLHFVLGFSVDEAAALTHVSPNTVKTRIRLGKRRLLRRLRGLA
jgi:RNA polymerase sigma-70 factor (ECF subfamily)